MPRVGRKVNRSVAQSGLINSHSISSLTAARKHQKTRNDSFLEIQKLRETTIHEANQLANMKKYTESSAETGIDSTIQKQHDLVEHLKERYRKKILENKKLPKIKIP